MSSLLFIKGVHPWHNPSRVMGIRIAKSTRVKAVIVDLNSSVRYLGDASRSPTDIMVKLSKKNIV